jgi:hypothetical protein
MTSTTFFILMLYAGHQGAMLRFETSHECQAARLAVLERFAGNIIMGPTRHQLMCIEVNPSEQSLLPRPRP